MKKLFTNKRVKKSFSSAFILLILLPLGACSNDSFTDNIIIASSGKIESADPAVANTLKSLQLLNALGDTLYEINDEGLLEPQLASSLPKFSKDKLRIEIELREDVFFHDGTVFNSEAMKFTIERFQRIGRNSYILGDNIKSIETPRSNLLIINLKKPSSSINGLLTSIYLTPISPTFYKNHSDEYLNQSFIGTGEYILESFTNEVQVLEPNPNYWGQEVKNNGIDFVWFGNSASLYGAFTSKQVDVLLSNSIDDSQRNMLKNLTLNGFIKEGSSIPNEISFVALRTNQKPFDNRDIRLALALSLNRSFISEKVSYGLRDPIQSLLPPIFKTNDLNPWPEYNPVEARKILTDEGFCDGNQLIVPLYYRSNVETDKLIALTWQQQINETMSDCMVINISGIESTTIYKNLSEGLYPAVILDWTAQYSDPIAYLAPLLSCEEYIDEYCLRGESVFSGSFWASSQVETLFQESEELQGEERIREFIKIDKITSEAIPYIPIWISSQKAWVQTNISIPRFNNSGLILMSELEKIED